MIIYADLIFIMNFWGDFLCLWLLSEINRKIPLWRRLLGASAGALFGLLSAVIGTGALSDIILKLFGAVSLTAICYLPMKLKPFVKSTVIFFVSSMVLAGGAELAGANGSFRIMLALFGTACIAVGALAFVRSKIYAKYLPCELCFKTKKVRFLGFYDSGNRLVSGNGGQIAIVGDERILKKLISKEASTESLYEWADAERIVTVPFCGASGGVMKGIVLDYLRVGERQYDGVILAISRRELSDSLILHSIMS